VRLCLLLALTGGLLTAADEAALRAAADAHRWFDLRDAAIPAGAPHYYRLLTAAAFNDLPGARKELAAMARAGAISSQLADGHYAIYQLHRRNGQYREAVDDMLRIAALAPDRAPSPADKADADALALLPALKLISRKSTRIAATDWQGSGIVGIPAMVNGMETQFGLDTGAAISVVTEAEARRLRLRFTPGQAYFEGSSGTHTTGRYAVASRLKIGDMELRDVAFLVLVDGLDLFAAVPLGQQGIIGLPVLMALRTVRWSHSPGNRRQLTLGFPSARPKSQDLRDANLAFDDNAPLASFEFEGRRLSADLDTGGRTSSMWPLFVRDFPALYRDARHGMEHYDGATGPATIDALYLPELRLKIGGFPIVFRDAPAMLRSTVAASNWHYCWLGMDLLNQAREVTLDFPAMRIELK
jgi:predicted aspartyl protease